MIGAFILGAALGLLLTVGGILWRWWMGIPTLVTAGGWAVGPLRWGGWTILIGAIIALAEVLMGNRLRNTWGIRFVLSAVGSMLGGLAAWWVWVTVSNPPAKPDAVVKP